MQDSKFEIRRGAIERYMIWKALAAVTIGALLGALAKLPYDQLMGFSEPACIVLRCWTSIAMLTSLSARDLPEPAMQTESVIEDVVSLKHQTSIARWSGQFGPADASGTLVVSGTS